ncbi:hypothetical protein Nepgr_017055 [Nepenthes gracilis]|uniref:GDT1 family protein n=1 Tax=Nepenthes gracilis TaxID=150966 RepID=A0AAD3SQV7_NEPGR|nr:hypothetical protein Nepgr_017055 [Nepenthes gracilis]
MTLSVVQGFTKSLAMTVVSEIGDKTFFAAAILAMRHPRRLVLSGCLAALIVMTILSAVVGWATPNLISRKWTHHITTLLFFGFGLWSLWDGFHEGGEAEELDEVEKKLDADWNSNSETSNKASIADDESKKKRRPFLRKLLSPIFLKAFSITFFGEWGDKSQLATIGLAADENPFGVVLGGIIGQALCTTAAVVGGKSLASQISEKIVALTGGALFIVFGIQSFLSTVDSWEEFCFVSLSSNDWVENLSLQYSSKQSNSFCILYLWQGWLHLVLPGHNYIGSEHLLLGLLREGEGEGVAACVLENLGADPSYIRAQVRTIALSFALPSNSFLA